MPVEYHIITTLGEQTPQGNPAFKQLEQSVQEAIQDGWHPLGGVSIASVVGPEAWQSEKDTWWLRVAQALVRDVKG